MQSSSNHWPNRAVLLAAYICALTILITACSSSNSKDSPAIVKNPVIYSKTEGMIALEADPFIQADRQDSVFGEDLWAMSVLPIQITVHNNGEHPVRIETKNFKLSLPTAEVIAPRSAAELTKWLASQGSTLGQVGMGMGQIGIGQIGQFAGPYGSIAGAVISGLYGLWRSKASNAHDEPYSRGEFKDATVAKNQFIRGFVFFMLPPGTPAFNEATLTLSVFENQIETSHIELPLKAMGYKGTASK